MDTNTAGVLALLIMASVVIAIVWIIARMRIRLRRTELDYDREHAQRLEADLGWHETPSVKAIKKDDGR